MPWLDKHTLPRLARSALDELQQNQHEKASLVCVQVQSPSGLALQLGAVCVEYGRPKWPITMLNSTNTYIQKKCFCFYFWHPMLVRPVMKRLFFPWKTKEKIARFARAPHYLIVLQVRTYVLIRSAYTYVRKPYCAKGYPRRFEAMYKRRTVFCHRNLRSRQKLVVSIGRMVGGDTEMVVWC